MRTFLFIAVLFAMFIFAIVAGYKPSMIEKEYNQIKEPIKRYIAGKNAETWRLAKDKEWQSWSKRIELPADCANPRRAIRELECKNLWQIQANTFENIWAEKVSKGWKPDGID